MQELKDMFKDLRIFPPQQQNTQGITQETHSQSVSESSFFPHSLR